MSTAARIDELRKKFEENPRRYFAPLANELRKAGELTQAIALCREHLPKQPGHMSGYIVFGQALFESGESEESRTVFEQALALDPENLIALHHLGHIAKQQGDTAAARRWYERALETDPRNDDIAFQLAALATPVRPVSAIATPVATPAIGVTAVSTPPLGLGAIPTPPYPSEAIGLGAMPTPDSAMRAVDFDEVNERMRAPESSALLDLEAIEAVGDRLGATAADVPVPDDGEPIDLTFDEPAAAVAPLAETRAEEVSLDAAPEWEPSGQAMADDPFAFADAEAFAAAEATAGDAGDADDTNGVVDLDASFEEGLVAEEWPDASALMARTPTPRNLTPVSVDIPVEAIEAFGREPQDPVMAPLPEPEPDVFGAEADLMLQETSEEPESVSSLEAATETFFDVAADPVPVDNDVDAIVHALEADARASGESDDVVVVALPEPVSNDDEASFSDMLYDEEPLSESEPDAETGMDGIAEEPSPAFVTETMGELLVAQGFTERAVTVYEELVRRRPYDPVLSARLAELQEQMAAQDVPVASSLPEVVAVRTARERFAQLAARRVPRRTPAVAIPVVQAPPADSLSALFGSVTPAHDDQAAQALADAFAPVELDAELTGPGLFGTDPGSREATPAFGAPRYPTPARAATPLRSATPIASPAVNATGDYSFDRFFPDPANSASATGTATPAAGSAAAPQPNAPKAGDDLAQFSAWLKGLGNS